MGARLIDGEFQSDKYPTTPRGKVPLNVNDPMAQDLLWEYAQRRRVVNAELRLGSQDLEFALMYVRISGSSQGDKSMRIDMDRMTGDDRERGVNLARHKFKQSAEKERFFHRHRWVEFYYDMRADAPGGPRTLHGIAWACRCGRIRNGGSSL